MYPYNMMFVEDNYFPSGEIEYLSYSECMS